MNFKHEKTPARLAHERLLERTPRESIRTYSKPQAQDRSEFQRRGALVRWRGK